MGSPELLQYSGRIVLDTRRQEFRLLDTNVTTPMDPAMPARIGPAQIRRYRIDGDVLAISFVDPDGKVIASTVFRRLSAQVPDPAAGAPRRPAWSANNGPMACPGQAH